MHYDAWSNGLLVWTDAGCRRRRTGRKNVRENATGDTFSVSAVTENHPANKYITTNIIANILGLGWAATPAGLQAMEELAKLEESRRSLKGIASNEMCNFLILNISSLQLIPVNVIAYRSQYGSVNPASIVGAGIIATSISTLVGIVYFKIMDRKR